MCMFFLPQQNANNCQTRHFLPVMMSDFSALFPKIVCQREKMFTKLRVSSSNLSIEKGRPSKFPKSDDIVCNFCNCKRNDYSYDTFKYNRLCQIYNVAEDDQYFLLKCSTFPSKTFSL